MPRTLDVDKLQELILYIADKSADDPNFGATKLNKLLFFSDFLCYAQFGEPMTGARYQKLERGPAPRDIVQFQERLVRQGDAAVKQVQRFGYSQKRLVALRPPRLSRFTAQEIKLVDDVVDALWKESARGLSDLSHERMLGWQLADMKEDIPYETVFLSTEPLTDNEVERAQRFAAECGLLVDQ